MKKAWLFVAFLIFWGFGTMLFSGQDEWTKTESGSFRIERFWEETMGNYTWANTIVTYRNTTQKTFEKEVAIRATIYDSQKKMVDTKVQSFFAFEQGPIKPGFEGTVKIEIECAKGQAKSVSVKIDKAW